MLCAGFIIKEIPTIPNQQFKNNQENKSIKFGYMSIAITFNIPLIILKNLCKNDVVYIKINVKFFKTNALYFIIQADFSPKIVFSPDAFLCLKK